MTKLKQEGEAMGKKVKCYKAEVEDSMQHGPLKNLREVFAYLSKPELEKKIREKRKQMEEAAKALDFMEAAKLRDDIQAYQKKLEELKV